MNHPAPEVHEALAEVLAHALVQRMTWPSMHWERIASDAARAAEAEVEQKWQVTPAYEQGYEHGRLAAERALVEQQVAALLNECAHFDRYRGKPEWCGYCETAADTLRAALRPEAATTERAACGARACTGCRICGVPSLGFPPAAAVHPDTEGAGHALVSLDCPICGRALHRGEC